MVAIISLILSISSKDSILNLVGNAWAGFGAAFGPVILLSLLWKKTTWQGALVGMIVGASVVLIWVYAEHGYKDWYEILPGFICSFFSIVFISMFTQNKNEEIEKEFDKVNEIIKNN